MSPPDSNPARELAMLKQSLRYEISRATFYGYRLDHALVVRASSIERCIRDAELQAGTADQDRIEEFRTALTSLLDHDADLVDSVYAATDAAGIDSDVVVTVLSIVYRELVRLGKALREGRESENKSEDKDEN